MRLPLWPLQQFLRTCPDRIHADAISHMANHFLSSQPWEGKRLLELNGKRISLAITDTNNSWQFLVKGTRLARDESDEPWDVRIRGNLVDFLLLATRAEDPDSLFFARCLSIEGDTETGLHVKNLLDSFELDWDAHLSSIFGPRPVRAMARVLDKTGADSLLRNLAQRVRQSVVETASAAGKDSARESNPEFTYSAQAGAGPRTATGPVW